MAGWCVQAAQCSVCCVCSVVRHAQVLRYGASVAMVDRVHAAQRGMHGVVHAGGEVHTGSALRRLIGAARFVCVVRSCR